MNVKIECFHKQPRERERVHAVHLNCQLFTFIYQAGAFYAADGFPFSTGLEEARNTTHIQFLCIMFIRIMK